jgi:hypothetical protein
MMQFVTESKAFMNVKLLVENYYFVTGQHYYIVMTLGIPFIVVGLCIIFYTNNEIYFY